MRKALGSLGTFAVTFGTFVTLGIMGFLVFLWTGEGADSGRNALGTWRTIVLRQWITQAVTLSAVALRFINASQASLCTGLVAAMMLERYVGFHSLLSSYRMTRGRETSY